MVLRNTATEMGGGEDRSKWVAPVPDKKPGRENLHDLAAYRAYAKERGVDLTASKEKGPLDEEQERVRRLKQDAAQADAKSKQLRDSAKNAETQLNKSLLFQCVDSGSGRKVGNLLKDLVGGQKFDCVDHLENVVDYYCDSRSNLIIDTKF